MTTSVCGDKGWINYVNIDVWKLEETVNLLFLCPDREHTQTGKYYMSSGIDLFGALSREFLVFQKKLDLKAEEKWRNSDISSFEQRHIDFKFTDLRIVTEFMEYLKNNCKLQ